MDGQPAAPVGDVGVAPDQRPTIPFGEATPYAELGLGLERLDEAGGADRACEAELAGGALGGAARTKRAPLARREPTAWFESRWWAPAVMLATAAMTAATAGAVLERLRAASRSDATDRPETGIQPRRQPDECPAAATTPSSSAITPPTSTIGCVVVAPTAAAIGRSVGADQAPRLGAVPRLEVGLAHPDL